MRKIAGIGLFISALLWIMFFALALYSGKFHTTEFVALGVFFSISSISAIYYVWVTLFRKVSAVESVELETRIIKIQIEKRELLNRLEALEKNE